MSFWTNKTFIVVLLSLLNQYWFITSCQMQQILFTSVRPPTENYQHTWTLLNLKQLQKKKSPLLDFNCCHICKSKGADCSKTKAAHYLQIHKLYKNTCAKIGNSNFQHKNIVLHMLLTQHIKVWCIIFKRSSYKTFLARFMSIVYDCDLVLSTGTTSHKGLSMLYVNFFLWNILKI